MTVMFAIPILRLKSAKNSDTFKKNYDNFTLETQDKKQTLTFNNLILPSFQLVKTNSLTRCRFYILLFNKKHRINKSFYTFLI